MLFLLKGVFVLLIASACCWLAVPSSRQGSQRVLTISLLTLIFALANPSCMLFFEEFMPNRTIRYDRYVYNFCDVLGHPSFAIGRFFAAHPLLCFPAVWAYILLPLAMESVFVVYLYLRPEEVSRIVTTFIVNLTAAVPVYFIFPVSGPRYAFRSFPNPPLSGAAYPIHLTAPPNGIPSVHTSTALLCVALLWRWRWGRIASLIYLTLILASTLGLGEHYVFDLLCAVPYSWVVWKASELLVRLEPGEAAAWPASVSE